MSDISFKLLLPGLPYKTKHGGFGYCSVSLIKDGRDTILFDVGHYAVRKEIIKILSSHKINKVFISHLHYDHCLNIDLFVRRGIKIYLNKKEWDYLQKIRPEDVSTFRFFNKIAPRRHITLFDKGFNISKHVRALETIGHTAGHSSLIFSKSGVRHIIAGDAIKTYKDFKDPSKIDVPPHDYKKLLSTKRYIINNFDIIVPGHDNIIKHGESTMNKLTLKKF